MVLRGHNPETVSNLDTVNYEMDGKSVLNAFYNKFP